MLCRRFSVLFLLLSGGACARPESPPGGPEDRLPPIVVETSPDTFALVEAGLREFRFRFSERISERPTSGTLNDAVVVSPSAGNVRVRHSRDGISVEVQEGLLPGRVYRITVLPVIGDMFGNRLRDPFDLVISTGEEFVSNVVAGIVEDRVTGSAREGIRVEALFSGESDTVTHWNLSDPRGIFSLRYVPTGPFQVRAWQDRNRDGEMTPGEPRAPYEPGELPNPPDTSFTVLSLIEPDTTQAQLARVVVEDSVTLQFEFDDYLDPALPGVVIQASLSWESEEGDTVTVSLRVFHEHEYRIWESERADSTAAAEAAAQEQIEALPEDAADDLEVVDNRGPVGLSGLLLPAQTLKGVLEDGLEVGVPYQAAVQGVVNIAGVSGGGGTALVVWELPPVDTTAADSTAVADTSGAVPDTSQVGDTSGAVPDTSQVADTSGAVLPRPRRDAVPRPAFVLLPYLRSLLGSARRP